MWTHANCPREDVYRKLFPDQMTCRVLYYNIFIITLDIQGLRVKIRLIADIYSPGTTCSGHTKIIKSAYSDEFGQMCVILKVLCAKNILVLFIKKDKCAIKKSLCDANIEA